MALGPITESELLAEIHKATKRTVGGEGFRVEEIVEKTGQQRYKVERAIRKGLKNGTVRRTMKVHECMHGVHKLVPSYVFLKGKK